MVRRPPRSTQFSSSAASDVYKRQREGRHLEILGYVLGTDGDTPSLAEQTARLAESGVTIASSGWRAAVGTTPDGPVGNPTAASFAGALAAVMLARHAFAIRVPLPRVPPPASPVLFVNPWSGDGRAERQGGQQQAKRQGQASANGANRG